MVSMPHLAGLLLGVSLVVLPSVASAHIAMTDPPARSTAQKEGPCGAAGSVRGDRVTVFRPGETIVVSWNETVDHASHYRIAFDVDGDDDFVAPAGRDDLYNSDAVLVDGIADRVGGSYTQEVTLPDIECERCTLQLIQVMYGSGNYFQCADIALRAAPGTDAGMPPEPDGGMPMIELDAGRAADGGPGADASPPVRSDASVAPGTDPRADGSSTLNGGCSAAHSAPASAWAFGGLALLAALARRRRMRP